MKLLKKVWGFVGEAVLWLVICGVIANDIINRTHFAYTKPFISLLIVCEIAFNVGLVILFLSLGMGISFKALRNFRSKLANLKARPSIGIGIGLTINRLAALIPFCYLFIVGIGRLSPIILAFCAIDIIGTLRVWYLANSGLRKKQDEDDEIVVRAATLDDLDGILAVDAEAWGDVCPANPDMFRSRIATFPEGGVIVALHKGQIVAFTSLQLMREKDMSFTPATTWNSVSDNGTIATTHHPDGEWIYGVGLASTKQGTLSGAVAPLLLYAGRYVVTNRKKGIYLIGRLAGLSKQSARLKREKASAAEVREYALSRNRKGHLVDPELHMYESYGVKLAQPLVLIHEYMGAGQDPDAEDWNALVCWHNPFYRLPFPWLWGKVFSIVK